MTYQHVIVSQIGGPEKLELIEENALPEPKLGQVRVKVLTAGTGFTDTVIRQGQYFDVKEKPPFTLGYDWFGVVDKVGQGVDSLKVGDVVADMSIIGGYTQYLCEDADKLVPAPNGLDSAEAVCMILTYTTAYQMLTREVELKPGMTCLIHAAGGAVGTALLDLCRHFEIKAYATASLSKQKLVQGFGAHHIDYRAGPFEENLLQQCPEGVDAVFDTIGGRNWRRSYRCLKKGGKLVGFGALQYTTGEEKLPSLLWGFVKLLLLWKLIPDGKQTSFYNIQRRRDQKPEDFKYDLKMLFELLQLKQLHPVVAEVLPLSQAQAAHRKIDSAQVLGKIVLRCNES